ncbi:hypothetical protein [Hymenobacter glacialis]|nr:hypothetical protein [Hymenobacter glacialis]
MRRRWSKLSLPTAKARVRRVSLGFTTALPEVSVVLPMKSS